MALTLADLPTPINLSIWWNFGRCLGFILMVQTVTGLFLSMHYTAQVYISYDSVIHIIREVNMGWFIRLLHMNGASFFILCIFCHIGRSLYYGRYMKKGPWISGVLILILTMATAFLGYVLPWGQMRYWGATVITNLFRALPYIGERLVLWLWGGFCVDNATLTRFYSLHFLIPFAVAAFSMVHILLLHHKGSNNPLGLSSSAEKVPFHRYFTIKDIYGFIILIFVYLCIVFFSPYVLGEPDNFVRANPLRTPAHIVPEWYFLFAYAILRGVDRKLGGVLALFSSILILLALPYVNTTAKIDKNFQIRHINFPKMGHIFHPFGKMRHWLLVLSFILLTFLGSKPVEYPYNRLSFYFTHIYFGCFLSYVPRPFKDYVQFILHYDNITYYIAVFKAKAYTFIINILRAGVCVYLREAIKECREVFFDITGQSRGMWSGNWFRGPN